MQVIDLNRKKMKMERKENLNASNWPKKENNEKEKEKENLNASDWLPIADPLEGSDESAGE